MSSFKEALLKPTSPKTRLVMNGILLPINIWAFVDADTQARREDALFNICLGVAGVVFALWQS